MRATNHSQKVILISFMIAGSVTLTLGIRYIKAQDQNGQQETEYVQTNLVSNGYVKAMIMDTHVVNPWGMTASATSPFWVANQGTNTSTLYTVNNINNGIGSPFTVMIPTVGSLPPQGPTGLVFNSTPTAFLIPSGTLGGSPVPSRFIFANLNGTISGWNPASTGGRTESVIAVSTAGAVYTGLALGTVGSNIDLYAADFVANGGGIRIFDSSFNPAGNLVSHPFEDPQLPPAPPGTAWEPYNIANVNGHLMVAYDPLSLTTHLPAPGEHHGVIAEFTTSGAFIRNFAMEGQLSDPWGMALATDHFGRFSGDLLVGNFGNGRILAYTMDGHFRGFLRGPDHKPLENGFLWTLWFGNGANGADPNTLFITTGGQDEMKDGLIAAIKAAQ